MEKRLLLVVPPVLHGESWWANRIANKPHLASLGGFVRDLAEVRTLELDLEAGPDAAEGLDRLDDLVDSSLGLVGISCWTSLHYLGARAVAERIRRLAPTVPIVVGGHHPTAVPGDFEGALFDFVVRGDGEHPLRALCAEWPRRPVRERVLAGRPFAQTHPGHVDWERYRPAEAGARSIWVALSRGCAFRCRFCVEPQRGPASSRYSVGDSLSVVTRLAAAPGTEVVCFSDPLFGANRRWTEAFLEGIERLELPVMFWAETRTDLMTPELLDRFRRCRFQVDFGLDTASGEMVGRMGKASDPDLYLSKSREVLEHADAIGLSHGVYLVFHFPGETPETARETREWVDSLSAGEGPTSGSLSCQSFFILPGTDAFLRREENAARWGTEIRHPGWWRETGDHRGLATDVLPSREFGGREEEMRAFHGWNVEVNRRWAARHPPGVAAFRKAFYDL